MKFNGYRASHRNRWLLIIKNILTTQEFLLFEYYLDLMDFDRNHGIAFSTFEAYLDDVADVFGKSEDAVRIWHNGLLDKGFIKISDKKRHIYAISNPSRYIATKWGGGASKYVKEETNQKIEFILKNIVFFQEKEEKIQPENAKKVDITANNIKNSLGSSKGKSNVIPPVNNRKIVVIKSKVKDGSEYRKIYENGDSLNMSPADMEFIDQTLTEKIEILNEEQEKEIVQSYFDGDWEEYRSSLINY
jgi:hypothetical protein